MDKESSKINEKLFAIKKKQENTVRQTHGKNSRENKTVEL